jgi:hypothetical protein
MTSIKFDDHASQPTLADYLHVRDVLIAAPHRSRATSHNWRSASRTRTQSPGYQHVVGEAGRRRTAIKRRRLPVGDQ